MICEFKSQKHRKYGLFCNLGEIIIIILVLN